MNIEKATADTDRATVAIGNYRTHLDETKRGLAKLLARENITVRHESVPTAMFDVVNRVLVLPKFDSVSVDQYDLLIGHEVGHAKYSSGPTSIAILEKCRKFDGLHTYVNVLEDTRIERLMKDEYPGLRASFRRGYADFATHGPLFQEVDGEDIASYSFIDRINIQYKVGAHRAVPFTAAERAYFPRIDTLDSMTAVYALAKELYDADVEEQKNAPKQPPQESKGGQPSDDQPSQNNENTENQEGASESGDDSADDSADDTGKRADADAQDGEGREGEGQTGEGQDEVSEDELVRDDADVSPQSAGADTADKPSGPHARTDVANSKALEGIASTSAEHSSTPIEVDLRPLTPQEVAQRVVPFFDDVQEFFGTYPALEAASRRYLDKFNQKHGATVKFMAREFELKKTAKLAERARTSRTGRLDVSKLYAYKFREDLFKSVTVLPNGKSHGVVVVIDGSGSMQQVMSDTLDQALLFGSFAKAVGIPFKAVVFRTDHHRRAADNETSTSKALMPQNVLLTTILDTTAPKWKDQLVQTAAFAMKYEQGSNRSLLERDENGVPFVGGDTQYALNGLPHCDLGSTPLYGALLVAERFVEAMKSAHRLDKMTLLIVTDGSDSEGLRITAHTDEYGYYQRHQALIIRDTVTRTVYADYRTESGWNDAVTEDKLVPTYRAGATALLKALVGSIQERHGCRVVTIKVLPGRFSRRTSRYQPERYNGVLGKAAQFARIADSSTWSITEDDAAKSLKDDGQVVFHKKDIVGDAAILVSASRLHLDTEQEARKPWDKPQTPNQIKRAFVKHAVGASRNRVFVQTVIPFLA
jgi:hypothetical protein